MWVYPSNTSESSLQCQRVGLDYNHRCLSRCRTKYVISQTRSNPLLITLTQPVACTTPTLPYSHTSFKNMVGSELEESYIMSDPTPIHLPVYSTVVSFTTPICFLVPQYNDSITCQAKLTTSTFLPSMTNQHYELSTTTVSCYYRLSCCLLLKHLKDVIALQTIKLDVTKKTASGLSLLLAVGNFTSYNNFHQSIGHLVVQNPKGIYTDGHLVPARPTDFDCDSCNLSKSTHTQLVATQRCLPKLFEIIHADFVLKALAWRM
jgi:hypothetical protein